MYCSIAKRSGYTSCFCRANFLLGWQPLASLGFVLGWELITRLQMHEVPLTETGASLQEADEKPDVAAVRGEEEATPEDLLNAMSSAEADEVQEMARHPDIYGDLALSLAPGVFGHLDVKKAVLLMLLGGVHKETSEVSLSFLSFFFLFFDMQVA